MLDDALSAATVDATRDVVAALSASRDDLTWFAPPDAVPDVMRTRAVAAELVGPDATYHAADVRIGLMAIGAHTHYPAHRHAAAEHYLLISGGAFFSSGSAPDRWLGPGEVVVNPPLAWHATRTTDGAVLVLYTWSGDVSFDSYEMQA